MDLRNSARVAASSLWMLFLACLVSQVATAQMPTALPPHGNADLPAYRGFSDQSAQYAPAAAPVPAPTWENTAVPTGVASSAESSVQPVTYMNETAVAQPLPPVGGVAAMSLDELREAIKRKDAGAEDSGLYGRGMTLVLDDDGDKYIRFLSWGQTWTTFTDNNPGTVDAEGNLKDSSLDIGLRRVRFIAYSQLTKKYLIMLHVGINNQTFTNGGGSGTGGIGGYGAGKKPQVFVHDFWNEYTVLAPSESRDFSLSMGAGLLYWNGVSRKSSASTLSFMTVDAPVFNWPNIELTDQFARQLGWYAKGKYRKLDYRVMVTQPFNTDNSGALNRERAVNIPSHQLAYTGYFDWQFWDQESNKLPYKTSSWLGAKSVFNLGTGFYIHPEASGILDENDQLRKQRHLALGFDVYYDTPVGDQGAAATLYGVYYVFDYGDNYYRDVGIMNTGNLGSPAFLASQGITPVISGAGNRQPLMGTGEIFYLEGGYILPTWVLGPTLGKLQPFGAFTHKNLAWLDDPAFNWDVGLNYLIDGHHAKLTFQYSLRPQFIETTEGAVARRVSDGHKGEFIIQAQVAL